MILRSSTVAALLSLTLCATDAFLPSHLNQGHISSGFVPLSTSRKLQVTKFDEFEEDNIIEAALEQKNSKIAKNVELRKKIVAESIAPWRTLRLFTYAALGSGAALGGFITLAGVMAGLSGARSDIDLNTEVCMD